MGACDVQLRVDGRIAVLTIDRPPVNALSNSLRADLAARLDEVRSLPEVDGLVIACAGKTFVAGAEIAELGKSTPPLLSDIVARIEALPYPTAAAIFGTALGGGLELALGCTFRVALAGSRIGLPEVRLGILPGAGGTVRTTYLAGALVALELAGTGTPMSVEAAREQGLVDLVVDGDVVEQATAFLRGQVGAAPVPLPVRARRAAMPGFDPAAFDAAAAAVAARGRGGAVDLVARSIKSAVELPFAEALAAERALFEAAVRSPRAAALRHLFFAERAAARPAPDIAAATPLPVSKVGVVGAGTMGRGIALALAASGLPVTLCEINEEALGRGLAAIDGHYGGAVARGRQSTEAAAAERRLISGTLDLGDLSRCDLVIEASFEDMAVKTEIFAALEAVARKGAILATNTSYLDVNAIARATGRPESVLGLHFFSPANVMPLVEVVRAAATSTETLATALALVRRLGKYSVTVGVCHGFVGNRMLAARNAPLAGLLLRGARPADVDAAFRDFGWPMGPFEMQDLAGLDISWRNRKALGKVDPLFDRMCEHGRFGQKAGRGWYRYEDGSRIPHPAPEVEALIGDMATELGVARAVPAPDEVIAATHLPMVAEGRRILDEGIARSSGDIDVIWVHGYGFPRDRGGPMHWADTSTG